MLGSRTRLGALVALFALMGFVGCKCGKKDGPDGKPAEPSKPEYESTVGKLLELSKVDVATLLPGDVDLAIIAEHPDQVHAWLKAKPWWKGMTESPVFADLMLSGPMYELSTARHKLASLSPVDMKQPKLEELLTTPMGLAVTRAGTRWQVLMVKEIDLKVQALDRLAEAFNQIRDDGRLRTEEIEGVKVRTLALNDGRSLSYALYSNLLMMANDKDMLLKSVTLAAGKSKESLAAAVGSSGLFAKRGTADVLAYVRPAELSSWLALFVPLESVGISWKLGDTPSAKVVGLAPGENERSGREKALAEAQSMIPLEARLVVGHGELDLSDLWNRLAGGLGEKDEEEGQGAPDVEQALLAKLSGEAVLVITEFDFPLPDAALLLKASDTNGLIDTVSKTVSFLFGSEVAERKGDGGKYWASQGGQLAPAFALRGKWLVLGSSASAVESVLVSHAGKAPTLLDQAGFKERVLAQADPFYGLTYINCEHLFEDAKQVARQMISSSERFDENDLQDTLVPLFDALKLIGKMGSGLHLTKDGIEGSVVSL